MRRRKRRREPANEGLRILRWPPATVRAAVAGTPWLPLSRQEATYVGGLPPIPPHPDHTQPQPVTWVCEHPRDDWVGFTRPQLTYDGVEYRQRVYRCGHCPLEFPVRDLPYSEN